MTIVSVIADVRIMNIVTRTHTHIKAIRPRAIAIDITRIGRHRTIALASVVRRPIMHHDREIVIAKSGISVMLVPAMAILHMNAQTPDKSLVNARTARIACSVTTAAKLAINRQTVGPG
jgi:hypothetical protein